MDKNYCLKLNLNENIIIEKQAYYIEILVVNMKKNIQIIKEQYKYFSCRNFLTNIVLDSECDYKIVFKIIKDGKIQQIEQILLDKKDIEDLREDKKIKNKVENRINYISRNPKLNWRYEENKISIYSNGKILLIKGTLYEIWKNCEELKSLKEIKDTINIYDKEYIEKAVRLMIEKGVLIEL